MDGFVDIRRGGICQGRDRLVDDVFETLVGDIDSGRIFLRDRNLVDDILLQDLCSPIPFYSTYSVLNTLI